MYMTWFTQRKGKHKRKQGIVNLDDIQVMNVPDGEQFIKYIVDLLEKKKLNTVKPWQGKPSRSLTSADGQNLSMTIRWVPLGSDMEMLIDNRHTYIQGTQNTPEIHFDLPLALKMGWIKEIRTPMWVVLSRDLQLFSRNFWLQWQPISWSISCSRENDAIDQLWAGSGKKSVAPSNAGRHPWKWRHHEKTNK